METYQNTSDLDFNKVWLMFQETDKMFRESRLQSQETDKQILELKKQIDRDEKLAQKRINQLEELFTGQWGKLIESLVEGKLVQLLKERGINVVNTYTRAKNEEHDIEIDIIAANGEDTVVVEVKTSLKVDKVTDFIEKLNVFKKYFPKYNDNRIIGAVAFLRSDSGAINYSKKQGLLVIKATGDSAKIINEPNFKPKFW
jgi:hypothetical protein